MLGAHETQVQIIWQHFLFVLQTIFHDTQDNIIENNENLDLHNQMLMLNDLYIEARDRRSNSIDKAIDEENVDKILLEISKAVN